MCAAPWLTGAISTLNREVRALVAVMRDLFEPA